MDEGALEADARDRVAAGVAWLDEHRPDWRERVVLRVFDIRSACCCVLGQVFADKAGTKYFDGYEYGREAIYGRESLSRGVSRRLGFDANDAAMQDDYDRLQRAWTIELTADRAGAPS